MTDSKESIMNFFKYNIIQPIDEIRKNIVPWRSKSKTDVYTYKPKHAQKHSQKHSNMQKLELGLGLANTHRHGNEQT